MGKAHEHKFIPVRWETIMSPVVTVQKVVALICEVCLEPKYIIEEQPAPAVESPKEEPKVIVPEGAKVETPVAPAVETPTPEPVKPS